MISIVLAAIILTQTPAQKSDWVELQQNESKCVLHDFGEGPGSFHRGTRVWFGDGMCLKCSFSVVISRFFGDHRNVIDAGGMIQCYLINPHPMYYCYNVAFFDKEERLIACDGGSSRGHWPEKPGQESSVDRRMPIPKSSHEYVDSYKVAYCESAEEIGTLPWNENAIIRTIRKDEKTGKTVEKQWPLWKSDGELRKTPFKIHGASRIFPVDMQKGWACETREGLCRLPKTATAETAIKEDLVEKLEKENLAVTIGDNLNIKVKCLFGISKDNRIETWTDFKNTSNEKMFCTLYFAFFDKYGNLVGCSHSDTKIAPHGSVPSISVGGKQVETSGYQDEMGIPIPLGLEKKITSYKMTLYESNKPIGTLLATVPVQRVLTTDMKGDEPHMVGMVETRE